MFIPAFADYFLQSTPIIPAAANPGYCVSDLRRDFHLHERVGLKVMDAVMGRSAEEGLRMLIFGAVGPDGKDGGHARQLRGGYLATMEVREPSD